MFIQFLSSRKIIGVNAKTNGTANSRKVLSPNNLDDFTTVAQLKILQRNGACTLDPHTPTVPYSRRPVAPSPRRPVAPPPRRPVAHRPVRPNARERENEIMIENYVSTASLGR
jgi:hypothetical protein